MNTDYEAKSYTHQGNLFYDQKRYIDAIAKYQQALQISPSHAPACLNWGNALAKLGRHSEAIEKYQEALDINPADSRAYHYWGVALQRLQQFSEALKKFEKAEEIDQTREDIYFEWGKTLCNLGRYEEGASKFIKCLKINPRNRDGFFNLALAYRHQEKYDKAIKYYNKVLELNSEDAEALNNLGVVLYDLGRYEEALNIFREAITCKPNYGEAHINKGVVEYHLKNELESSTSYIQGIQLLSNKERFSSNVDKQIESIEDTLVSINLQKKHLEVKLAAFKQISDLLSYESTETALKNILQKEKADSKPIDLVEKEAQQQDTNIILSDYKLTEYYTFLYRELNHIFRGFFSFESERKDENEIFLYDVLSSLHECTEPVFNFPFAKNIFSNIYKMNLKEIRPSYKRVAELNYNKFLEAFKDFKGFGEVDQILKTLAQKLTLFLKQSLIADYNKEVNLRSQEKAANMKSFMKKGRIESKSEERAFLDLGILILLCFLEGIDFEEVKAEEKVNMLIRVIFNKMLKYYKEVEGANIYEICNMM